MRHSIAINVIAASPKAATGRLGFVRRATVAARGREAIPSLNIAAPSPGAVPGELSGGNQQKVVIAKWLLRKPAILLLNGPTVGVDVGAKAEIIDYLLRWPRRGNDPGGIRRCARTSRHLSPSICDAPRPSRC